MSYLNHLTELRNRLLLCFLFLFLCFIFYFYNSEILGNILSKPLFDTLESSENKRMIFTGLPEVFVSYLKISIFASFITSFPFFILQLCLFISPALYKREKYFFIPIFILIPFLFFLGVIFSYFILVPLIWNFFVSFQSIGNEQLFSVELESRFGEYMKLIMYLLFSGGFSFLFPIILLFLNKLNFLTLSTLKNQRKFFFIGILVFSAIFTPPDIISQIGIALPLYLFFEFTIFIISFLEKK